MFQWRWRNGLARTPNPPPDILIAPVLPTAGAWNRKELGFVRLAGWEASGASLTESFL